MEELLYLDELIDLPITDRIEFETEEDQNIFQANVDEFIEEESKLK